MNYYYLDAGNQPVGPLSLEDIRRRAGAGQISVNPMIAREGGQDWQPLSRTATVAASPAPGGFQFDQVLANSTAGLINTARAALTETFVDRSVAWARTAGNHAVVIGAVLGFAATITAAVKSASFKPVIPGLLTLVALAVAHYVARLAFAANDRMLATAPVRTSATTVLDYMALLALLSGLSGLVGAIVLTITEGQWRHLLPTVIGTAYCFYFAAVALHPALVRLDTAGGGLGQDVVGLVVFLLKCALKLVALPFFILAAAGCATLLLDFFDLAGYVPRFSSIGIVPLPRELVRATAGSGGLSIVLLACLLPLVAHLGFLVLHLPIDLWRALLSVPEKLDALKR